jgi:3-phosphoshikimate 1-carboxyvinyltransferase
VAASFAQGRTTMSGLEELVVKESDRLTTTAAALKACGVNVEVRGAQMAVEGRGAEGVKGGVRIATEMDHRIAMAFLTLGLASREPVSVDDVSMVATSFPSFEAVMRGLGADLTSPNL